MEISTSEPSRHAVTRREFTLIIASSFGALLEWYDFYIYAALAGTFSTLFFPSGNETTAFLASLATFGAGFLVRPLGALFFGRLGDRIGRKYTFMATIVLMGVATVGVGLLPSFARIGMLAPVLLVCLRLLQGFALGGETGGAATYLAEHSPARRRGLYTSSLQTTATLGLLASIAVVSASRSAMDSASFQEWGWRVPFLVSLALLVISVYLRTKLAESPTFQSMKHAGKLSKSPISESFGNWENLKYVLIMLFSTASGVGVVFGTGHFYSMYFLQNTLKVAPNTVNLYLAIALVCVFPFYLIFGWLSDRIGRKWIMMTACLLLAATTQPIFHALTHYANPKLEAFQKSSPVIVHADDCHFSLFAAPKTDCDRIRSFLSASGVSYQQMPLQPGQSADTTIGNVTVHSGDRHELENALLAAGWVQHADPAQINAPMVIFLMWLLIVYLAMVYGPMAAFMVELFPARIRYTSLSLPFHLGSGWFGGMLPFVVSAMAVANGNVYFGLWYPIVIAVLSLIVGVLFVPETFRRDVSQ
ncbi:MFS transporter [Paraburkholderia fungorum]|uniref:MFS family permease n=1 Tax=Paraburkholderia fungorum TaxID=134537 RepID=A0AAW3UPH1_9BURK|nr:MFS transporter [Paraburkholderia fungorum]MBB4511660.1 MFS family permease [Paraburkholderia fungorum]MBB6199566.1 MFS family permease [Paraburkholderia fungorum]